MPENAEPQTIFIPIVYEMQTNQTQVADPRAMPVSPLAANSIISNLLKRFADYHNKSKQYVIDPQSQFF